MTDLLFPKYCVANACHFGGVYPVKSALIWGCYFLTARVFFTLFRYFGLEFLLNFFVSHQLETRLEMCVAAASALLFLFKQR